MGYMHLKPNLLLFFLGILILLTIMLSNIQSELGGRHYFEFKRYLTVFYLIAKSILLFTEVMFHLFLEENQSIIKSLIENS